MRPARWHVHLALVIGGIAMVFPFYWMLSTAFKSPVEAASPTPIVWPDRLRPGTWGGAWAIGVEGRGGLAGGLFGGVAPGRTADFDLTVRLPEGADPAEARVSVPRPRGVLSFPLGDAVRVAVEPVGSPDADGVQRYLVRAENEGERTWRGVPLQLTLPRGSAVLTSEVAPDGQRNARRNVIVSWADVVPGLLGYVGRNFAAAWQAAPFGRYVFNSAFTAVVQVLAGLVVASLAGFALARIRFWGRDVLFIAVLGTLMVPGEVLLIPNYVLLARLGWIDTYQALIVPFIASAFGIFLVRQFFVTLPQELFDAARIDGAGWGTQLVRIALPLVRPGLLTYGLFAFLGAWNALLWPLIVTNSESMRTIQVGLQFFVREAGTEYGMLMAASTVAILPIIVGFLFVQKQFIEGIARAGIK